MEEFDTTAVIPAVSRVMTIEDITTGDDRRGYLARFRGRLYGDSADAYDQLAQALRPMEYTPLFRSEGDQHVVLIMPGVINPKPSNPWVNVLMFALTLLSVMFVGSLSELDTAPITRDNLIPSVINNLYAGLPFAASLLAILLAHEFGHYLMGRYHGTAVTLPYFIPMPFSPFGTMGAFIQLKEPPKNKRILLDIGIAGPLAGLVVAVPVLLLGLSLSYLNPIHVDPNSGIFLEGNSILYLLLKYLSFGRMLPEPASFGDLSPLEYWVRYFFTGQPLPLGGMDVMIHPIAFAGWAGLLVTALNLIPAGQLDGGHLLYGLFGPKAQRMLPFVLAALIGLGFVWSGWWLWALIIFLLGRAYAEPLDQITQLDLPRKMVALLGLAVFILVFTPVPLIVINTM
jgi:membrane-associated protease RseP (regulator of RpoE activity)